MIVGLYSDAHVHAYPAFAHHGPHGVNSRLQEIIGAARGFLQQCRDAGATSVFHCGDWFDQKDRTDGVVMGESTGVLNDYQDLQHHLLHGNHEEAAGGLRTLLDAFRGRRECHVAFAPTRWDIGSTRFFAIPFTRDRDTLLGWLTEAREQRDAARQNVLLLHAQIDGARTSSEYRIPGTLTLAEIVPTDWALVFCGHTHEPQSLTDNVHIIGSVTQRSFSDAGAPRRGFLFDTESCELRAVPIPGPRFRTVTITDHDDLATLVPTPETDPTATAWYQRIYLGTTEITPTEIGELLGTSCRGWSVVSIVKTSAPTVAVGGTLDSDWHQSVRRCVERLTPTVPIPQLLEFLDSCIEGEWA